MRIPASGADRHPPAWAEWLLRALLAPRDRDTVNGDLLEEYREGVLPSRGSVRANLWYIRQVASFVTVPVGVGVFIAISVALGTPAVISTRSRVDILTLWRIGLVCGLLVTAVLLVRLLFEVFDPIDPAVRFLAQGRDDYSEFNYPRRWVPAAAIALILMGGGLRAAWRSGRVGAGTLAAAAASVIGSLIYVTLVALGNALPVGPRDALGNAPGQIAFFGNVPIMLIPVLAMFSTVLGTVGGLFGKAFGGVPTRPSG